jgi:hypothetical protein
MRFFFERVRHRPGSGLRSQSLAQKKGAYRPFSVKHGQRERPRTIMSLPMAEKTDKTTVQERSKKSAKKPAERTPSAMLLAEKRARLVAQKKLAARNAAGIKAYVQPLTLEDVDMTVEIPDCKTLCNLVNVCGLSSRAFFRLKKATRRGKKVTGKWPSSKGWSHKNSAVRSCRSSTKDWTVSGSSDFDISRQQHFADLSLPERPAPSKIVATPLVVQGVTLRPSPLGRVHTSQALR